MNKNDYLILRHGTPLFYPQDPSEGFQGASRGLSRRKFLKRTGGATAAAFFAAVPMRLAGHDDHGESEEWNMDFIEFGGTETVEATDDIEGVEGAHNPPNPVPIQITYSTNPLPDGNAPALP